VLLEPVAPSFAVWRVERPCNLHAGIMADGRQT
jgi:hypothetical protein